MKKDFTTEELEGKIEKVSKYSYAMILIGIVLLAFKDYSGENPRGFIQFIDAIVLPTIGIILAITYYIRLKKMKGSYLKFTEKGISFQSRLITKDLSIEQIAKIKIKLKTIDISLVTDEDYQIYMEDYSNFSDKKDIKQNFEIIKELVIIKK